MINKILFSILIALMMSLTLCPTKAYAEEIAEDYTDDSVEDVIEDTEEESDLSGEIEPIMEDETDINSDFKAFEEEEIQDEVQRSEQDCNAMIPYLDEKGKTHYEECHGFDFVQDSRFIKLEEGTYFVSNSRTINNRLYISGDVNLILGNNVSLTMNEGICVEEGAGKLEIFAQSMNSEYAGKLYCWAENGQSALGSNGPNNNGTIVIHGGYIEAHGGESAAGIGGGIHGEGGTIELLGGTIRAYGGRHSLGVGAGIGGGDHADGGNIHIENAT